MALQLPPNRQPLEGLTAMGKYVITSSLAVSAHVLWACIDSQIVVPWRTALAVSSCCKFLVSMVYLKSEDCRLSVGFLAAPTE